MDQYLQRIGCLRQDNATPWFYSSRYQFYENRYDLHGEPKRPFSNQGRWSDAYNEENPVKFPGST